VRASVDKIVAYLWEEERADYLAADDRRRKRHIFKDLVHVLSWLYRLSAAAEAKLLDTTRDN